MVEKKVADTILQSNFTVEAGGAKFNVAPPRTATIIRLSELVVNLPMIDSKEYLDEVLKKGRNAKVIGDVFALLVCGEIPPLRIYSPVSIFAHFKRAKRYRKAKRHALYRVTPRELMLLISQILGRQEISDFFTLIASLRSANILRETKTTPTTASGQQ